MDPRAKNQTKWSSLPTDVTKLIQSIVNEQFAERIEPGEFIVEGRIFAQELALRIGHLKEGHLKQDNFEGSIDYTPGKDQVTDLIQLLFEATSSMMESFVADPEQEFPVSWQEYQFSDKKIFLRYSTVNSSLEKQADLLLGADSESLVQQDMEEQLEEIKASLGLDSELLNDEPNDPPKKFH